MVVQWLESGLPFVILTDADKVVGPLDVQFGEQLGGVGRVEWLQQILDQQKWVVVLNGDFV